MRIVDTTQKSISFFVVEFHVVVMLVLVDWDFDAAIAACAMCNTKLQSPNPVMFNMFRHSPQARSAGCHILVHVFVLTAESVRMISVLVDINMYFAILVLRTKKKFPRCPLSMSIFEILHSFELF